LLERAEDLGACVAESFVAFDWTFGAEREVFDCVWDCVEHFLDVVVWEGRFGEE
jgi:hypothetical protein